jgi:hypothetical protein
MWPVQEVQGAGSTHPWRMLPETTWLIGRQGRELLQHTPASPGALHYDSPCQK